MTNWNSCVLEPSVAIISAIMRGEKPEQRPLLNEDIEDHKYSDYNKMEYNYCEVIFISYFVTRVNSRGTYCIFHLYTGEKMLTFLRL